MDKQLTELLEKLANKLGVTAEYLWGVLLKQAKVSAFQSLIFIVALYIAGLILFFLHQRFIKPESNESYSECHYEKSESTCILMGVGLGIWATLFLAHFFSWSNLINGFFNPEYWALTEILDTIK